MSGPSGDPDYERLVEACPDIVYRLRVRPSVRVEYINPACERFWGYRPEEVIGQGLEFLQSLLANQEDGADIANVAAGRRFYPVVLRRYRRKDGVLIWGEVHTVPLYDATGALEGQHGTIRDVTEREEALSGMKATTDRLTKILGWMPDLVMTMDREGRFTSHVPTGSRQPAELFLGRHLVSVLYEEDQDLARHTLAGAYAGAPGVFSARVMMPDSPRLFEFRLAPTGDGDVVAMIRDLSGEASRTAVSNDSALSRLYHLTARESGVLQWAARGATDKEIARELGISASTVSNHMSAILAKMGAASRTEAVIRAIQAGLASARLEWPGK